MSATIKDIAKRAGVSVATVSRVINGLDGVRPQTRERVLAAMKELDYSLNAAARTLRVSRSQMIGLMVPDISNSFFGHLARGIGAVLRERGFRLALYNTELSSQVENDYVSVIREQRLDGVIVAPVSEQSEAVAALHQEIPTVLVDRRAAGLSLNTVLVDNAYGARLAVEHLIKLGHREIACITGPDDITTGRERAAGYRRALQAHGIPVRDGLLESGEFSVEFGAAAMERILDRGERPTAVFAGSNYTTVGALQALTARGISVPGDVALVGFDDFELGAFLEPPVTVVEQPIEELGAAAARLLLETMERSDFPPREVMLKPRMIVRRSCGSSLQHRSKEL